MIRKTFRANDALLKLLRKLFVPTYSYNSELGQQPIDAWRDIDFSSLPADEAKIQVIARLKSIAVLEQGLLFLQILANQSEKTPDELEALARQNSSK